MPPHRAWDAGGEVMRGKGRRQERGGAQLVSGDPSLSQHQRCCFSRLEFQISFPLWPLITPRGGGGWARERGWEP